MYQKPQSFKAFADLKGIHLLRDDIAFIKKHLLNVPYNLRRSTLERYAETWLSAMSKCDIVYQRQNKGRYAANIQLLGD